MINMDKARAVFSEGAMRSIYRWTELEHSSILAISLIGIANSLLSLGVPLSTKGLIDGATSGQVSLLWRYGIALVLIIVIERVLNIVATSLRNRTNARFQMEMQQMVTRALLGKEYAAIKPYHSGELVNRIFSDVSAVKSGVMNLIPSILQTLISFIGAAVILVKMDWRFLPVILASGLIGVVVTAVFRDPMKERHRRMQEAEGRLHASTQENLANIRLVKASLSEGRAQRHMDQQREQLAEEQIRNGRLSIAMNNGLRSVFDLTWLICQIWGCVKIYQGTFTYGSLAALIQLVGRIQSPIANAIQLISQAYGVVTSAERLQEVIGLPDEEEGIRLDNFDEIQMEHVDFHYADGNDEVLTDVNFTVRRGDFVALTGISGGGKTSLFQLLLGIYRPTAGIVLFRHGEKEISACRGTRSLFAYVPQGNTLMSGTLRENLMMFTDHATEEAMEAAIHAACLEDVVAENGLDVRLGERGIGLSEGQAQRVAIARALLSDAPILLLDEATSALDEATEAKLLANIGAMQDKTVLIVTHRRAALEICDYQLMVENGRVTRREMKTVEA